MSYLGRPGATAPLTSADIPDNSITAAKIVDATIAAGDLAPNSVDSSELVDGGVDNSHLADNAVDTAEIADNAVTLAKMAGGTDGQVITYDASGDPVAVGPGTDGQVLTSTGAGSPPAFEAVPSFDADAAQVFNESGADVDFRVEGSGVDHALFVRGSDGHVGIGSSNPYALLNVDGGASPPGTGVGKFTNSSSSSGYSLVAERSNNNSSSDSAIRSVLAPASDQGADHYHATSQPGGQWDLVAYMEWDGDWYSNTGTDIQTISDVRLKENIEDYTGGLDIVNALQPRTFEWKADFKSTKGEGTKYGFIAQEIEAATGVEEGMNLFSIKKVKEFDQNPELTEKYKEALPDGKRYNTQLSAKDVIIISAIQELSAKNDALEAENTALKTRMDALEARVTALEG